MQLYVGFRVHQKNTSADVDLAPLLRAARLAIGYADYIGIAVSTQPPELRRRIQCALENIPYVLIPVTDWTFVEPLNALLADAVSKGCTEILFQSCEVAASPCAVKRLLHVLRTDKKLVVGARLRGHSFSNDSKVPLSGVTSPWNTCAVWDTTQLQDIGGFNTISNSCGSREGGVEEVVVIAIATHAAGGICVSSVVDVAGIEWSTSSLVADPGRAEWHARKMASKCERAAAQLNLLPNGPQKLAASGNVLVSHDVRCF